MSEVSIFLFNKKLNLLINKKLINKKNIYGMESLFMQTPCFKYFLIN